MFALLLLAIIATLPLVIGAGVVIMSRKNKKVKGPKGLLFHAITPRQYTHFSYFSPDKFSRFIEALVRRNIATSTLEEALKDGATNKLVITFDDGFCNFYTEAFPVLEASAIKVTLFPIVGFIGRFSQWDILPQQAHLSKGQIRDISNHGHEIGSHTMTHANLTFLRDDDVKRELRDSKQALEDIIGKPVTSLSFPFGSWNKRVWEIAQQVGYTQGSSYHSHGNNVRGLIPVRGVYSFDTVQDVLDKVDSNTMYLNAVARCSIMSHFAKGTPLWKFRENYTLISK